MSGPEMSGPGHYREAERRLSDVDTTPDRYGEAAEYCRQQLATAQVHATLAVAAATAYPAVRDEDLDSGFLTSREWAAVAS